ncbi:D-alanyl-D-alanine carboxypeptidase family protein [Tengunoibacter tsumagoiensis]|uniref:Peptidase S11 D-alanyl-D-alanine carboxypeptidase A N-terminal domain-containing protein n=1 Tax=Tengunoibacter tsumagoiensis TaxID=2014871 RepID=A0A402AA83_9CHLR|nr:serine hydrolase [Tengunoibacter tsumagoiensis]GCE16077.1 hypothetical protein KTT_59360 [Tengunoibacter tsumagoiensis]
MKRYVFATIFIMIAVEVIVVGLFAAFTPVGNSLLAVINPPPAPPPAPVLSSIGVTPPTLHAQEVYLLDQDTGNILLNINGDQRVPMASTTKIMTALVALQKGKLDQIVTIKQDAPDEALHNNGSTAQLAVGDQLPLIDLLYALMLPSGDDAAVAIADAISGSPAAFVQEMNAYAQKLHLKNTHFINPDGLTVQTADGKTDATNVNHYSTAADLAQLTRIALKNPLFAQIVQLQHYELPASGTHRSYTTWDNTNELLKFYPAVTGVKTGYTPEAGPCLVFSAFSAGHHLIGVILHEKVQGDDENDTRAKEQRFLDAEQLLDWGFALPLKVPATTGA